MKENNTSQITSTKRKFKAPFARKNSEEKIPFEKVSFSSAEMVGTLGQKNTTMGKSVGVQDDKKLLKNIGIMILKDLVDFYRIEPGI